MEHYIICGCAPKKIKTTTIQECAMNSAIIMAGTRTISIFGVNFTMQNLINYLNETTYTRVRINYTYIQTYNTPPF